MGNTKLWGYVWMPEHIMPNRRTVILGMATVAFGSGAMAMNASFEQSVEPGSDFRVVAQRDLTVAPGVSFRDAGGDYAGTINDTGTEKYYDDGNSSFFSDDNPSDNSTSKLGGDLSVNDLPAISVNDAEDGSLVIKFAVANTAAQTTFENALQVTNDGDQTEDLGVVFKEFGADATGGPAGSTGLVDVDDIVQAISFEIDGTKISTDNAGFSESDASDQEVANAETIGLDETKQIDIVVDLQVSDIVQQIASASEADGNPFDATGHDTVQLVETVEIGVGPTVAD